MNLPKGAAGISVDQDDLGCIGAFQLQEMAKQGIDSPAFAENRDDNG